MHVYDGCHNPHSGRHFYCCPQVSWGFEGPKLIRAEVLYDSIKKGLLICSACPNCEAASLEPHTVALTGPLFPNQATSPRPLLATGDSWSCRLRGHVRGSTESEVIGPRLQTRAERLLVCSFAAQASSDWSLQNLVSQVQTVVRPGISSVVLMARLFGEDWDEDESELLKCQVQCMLRNLPWWHCSRGILKTKKGRESVRILLDIL